ncbi:MAG: hypothetical protein JWM36_3813 [Hyphomicrobiales bacterium]|nr:hypothetical protein [Hyphomicrobiales bacterium]
MSILVSASNLRDLPKQSFGRIWLSVREVVDRDGCIFIEGYEPERPSAEVAPTFGKILSVWGDNDPVQELVPINQNDAAPNTYSGIFGRDRFPFHTDLAHWRDPPRYLMLRCVKGYSDIPTPVIDGRDLVKAIGPDLLNRALVKPRRPCDGRFRILRLREPAGERLGLIRWDEVYLKPVSNLGELAISRMKAEIAKRRAIDRTLAKPGDTMIIDNWRMLHARAPVPAGLKDRIIERTYLGELN